MLQGAGRRRDGRASETRPQTDVQNSGSKGGDRALTKACRARGVIGSAHLPRMRVNVRNQARAYNNEEHMPHTSMHAFAAA